MVECTRGALQTPAMLCCKAFTSGISFALMCKHAGCGVAQVAQNSLQVKVQQSDKQSVKYKREHD